MNKKLSTKDKIKALINFYGLTRREAIIQSENVRIILDFLEAEDD